MIDSHCHLDHEPLLSDLTNVIKRSKEIGINKLLTISTSFESFDRIKTIIQKDEMIYGTIGIHPHETNKNKITSDMIIKNITENNKIIGIGETGLDFYYNKVMFPFENWHPAFNILTTRDLFENWNPAFNILTTRGLFLKTVSGQ